MGQNGGWRVWLMLALAAAIALVGACGSGSEPAGDPEPSPPTEETPTPTPTEPEADSAETLELGEPLAAIPMDMPEDPAERNGMFDAPPARVIDDSQVHYAVLHTEKGDITIQLFADRAPVTVNNFVYLALTGFYDDTMFHRVIENFMAQGGDPRGTGSGGPGYRFQDEMVSNLNFDRPGLLAMANAGPGTNGSQFFITFVPTPHLNQNHTIFGEVIEGMEVVNSIQFRDPGSSVPGDRITGISIHAGSESHLPEPEPTPTPTPVPTPYAPHEALADDSRPLAALSPEERIGLFNTPPDPVIDLERAWIMSVETNHGTMEFALLPEWAPQGVNNAVVLARLGYFDGVQMYTFVSDQVSLFGILGGTRAGVVGYTLDAERGYGGEFLGPGLLLYSPDWTDPNQVLGGGLVINHAAFSPEIVARFTVIGELTAGMDVLEAITSGEETQITSVTVAAEE